MNATTDTSSAPDALRHQPERVGTVDGGGVVPRLPDGEGGDAGDGDLGVPSEPASATAARMADTEGLISRLEGELVEVDAARAEARDTRARHALAAAEGDPAARTALQAASEASARLEVGRENVDMALAAARARLAGLEEELRREEIEQRRRWNIKLCHERVALAGRIDALLGELAPVVEEWSGLGLALYGTAAEKPGVVGGGYGFLNTKFFQNALPRPVAEALGKRWFAGDFRPLAVGDPAAATVRHTAGKPEPVGRRYPTALEMLGNPVPPAEAEPEAEPEVEAPPAPEAEVAVEVAPRPAPFAASDATLGGMRLVGGLAGGGGVWERVRPGDAPPAEAA